MTPEHHATRHDRSDQPAEPPGRSHASESFDPWPGRRRQSRNHTRLAKAEAKHAASLTPRQEAQARTERRYPSDRPFESP